MTAKERSRLFTGFNAAMSLARAGQLDEGRVKRGLGVAQTSGPSHVERYGSTANSCGCPDHQMRHETCKGMLAVAMLEAGREEPVLWRKVR